MRKWEEEWKLRETKYNDASKEFTRLEDYVRKTEARNVELEKIVRTLQHKTNLLESESCLNDGVGRVASDGYSRPVHNSHAGTGRTHDTNNIGDMVRSSNSGTDQLIAGVREQVTQFIMKE